MCESYIFKKNIFEFRTFSAECCRCPRKVNNWHNCFHWIFEFLNAIINMEELGHWEIFFHRKRDMANLSIDTLSVQNLRNTFLILSCSPFCPQMKLVYFSIYASSFQPICIFNLSRTHVPLATTFRWKGSAGNSIFFFLIFYFHTLTSPIQQMKR